MKESASDSQRSWPASKCPSCHARLPAVSHKTQQASFCLYCGAPLGLTTDKTAIEDSPSDIADSSGWSQTESASLVKGHEPDKDEVKFTIGAYQVLDKIGKGGMGEVFLAYDTECGRRIALKRIRNDLVELLQLQRRFLKEARITSQLTHPAIIPIYSIHATEEQVYYTMPYVEGNTLKQILRQARQQTKGVGESEQSGTSIRALVRLFVIVCQATAYAHDKGVLHRDLKPENMIIGPYGEVMILDWGLAKLLEGPDDPEAAVVGVREHEKGSHRQLTRVGKVVGTVAYMAPERALGQPASIQTEIYALGVTLYQILTLHLPFRRGTLKEFRQRMGKELLPEPSEVAPYREVPPAVAQVVRRCLEPKAADRYQTVNQLIHDLEVYLEGRSEWFPQATLDLANKSDWEFQENVLIADYVEVTRNTELSDWFSLMISRSSFSGNIRLEATVCLNEDSAGIGFLLGVPEAPDRKHVIDGYCLWAGSTRFRDTKLLRTNVEVMRAPEATLDPGTKHHIAIEKLDSKIHFYLDGEHKMTYISHLPLVGTHVGLLSRDVNYSITDFAVYGGSQQLTVNCLAVPDAFLAHKDYDAALVEYRRIAYSFPGRTEGREAMFRAGITLLEQAKNCGDASKASDYYERALDEFAKLHNTPGAPLEYLGKALVYQTQGEYDEEFKCFELALRRYPKHPLLYFVQEQVVHRMHEASRRHRKATYNFALLVVHHLPNIATTPTNQHLFKSLQKHWEPLPFLNACPAKEPTDSIKNRYFAIALAFWLAKPYALVEIIEQIVQDPVSDHIAIGNALFALIELGSWKLASHQIEKLHKELNADDMDGPLDQNLKLLKTAILGHEHSIYDAITRFLTCDREYLESSQTRVTAYLMELALVLDFPEVVSELATQLEELPISPKDRLTLQAHHLWAQLLEGNWATAGELINSFPLTLLSDQNSPLYFLYGCWLHASEGPEIAEIHFSGVLDVPYPRLWALTSHYLGGKIHEESRWFKKSFLWERRLLYRQLSLYYRCGGDLKLYDHYKTLAREQYVYICD